mmetsp:Transcript_3858/g.8408  ORF Transcript_3858/g.8408 Transcript_3858/m.8408 type:complete len:196 (-) Transcript_3858:1232-1819(-)
MLVCIGQTTHTVTSYMTIWASGYRVRSIKPIEVEKALKDGAEFIGEGFVLSVSAAVAISEYNRSAKSTARKNEQKRERIKATQDKLQAKLNTLDVRIRAVEDLIKQQQELEDSRSLLTRVVPVGGTEKPKYIEPPKEQLVPIADSDNDAAATPPNKISVNQKGNSQSENSNNSAESSVSSNDETQEPPASWWKFW